MESDVIKLEISVAGGLLTCYAERAVADAIVHGVTMRRTEIAAYDVYKQPNKMQPYTLTLVHSQVAAILHTPVRQLGSAAVGT